MNIVQYSKQHKRLGEYCFSIMICYHSTTLSISNGGIHELPDEALAYNNISLSYVERNHFSWCAEKNAILPQPRPDTSYNVTPIRLIRSDDSSLGVATYRIRSFNLGDQAGWTIATEEITVTWKNGQYQGYQVNSSAQRGGYDPATTSQIATKLNIPLDVLESSIIAHEKQHMADHKKYKSLNFIGFEDTSVDNQTLQQRHNEISVRLEARAVSAQINAFYKGISNISSKFKNLTQKLNNHNTNSAKKVAKKKYNAKALLDHDQYVALQNELNKLRGYLDACLKKG